MPAPSQLPATWDAVAAGYAEEIVPHMALYAEEALRAVPPRRTDRVLDLAAGPGALAFVAAPRVAHVDAVDFSPAMIAAVRARAAREGVGNVDAAVMDAQVLTFPDAGFDAAYCLFGFMFFPDRARAFAELRRTLRPGGRALMATWAPIDRRPLMQIAFDAMAEALPDLPRPAKGDLQQSDECVREMTAAGFRDVETRLFSAPMRFTSPEHYLRVQERAGAPYAALKARLGDEAWAAAWQRLLDAVRRRLPAGGADLGAEAILTSGTV